MPSNPRRSFFGRRPAVDRASADQLAQLTTAFFDCEARMSKIDPGVQAAHAAGATPDPTRDWHQLREQYDSILSEYLRLTTADSDAATPAAVSACQRAFQDLAGALDRFAHSYRKVLEAAQFAIAGSARAEQEAMVAATRASNALAAAPAEYANLSTVRAAADALSQQIGQFDVATGMTARSSAAEAVIAAAADVEAKLAAAPNLANTVEKTIRSLTTRIQGLETQLSTVPGVMSSLLREFSSGCSDDLATAAPDSRRAIDDGTALLEQARSLVTSAPDQALAVADQARDRLSHADVLIDSVLDRQRELRDVKADPSVQERRVRFRLRDAQHFAMDHGRAGEWGSVLDAQSDRIDRAVAELDRIHPDYWAYLTELRTVDNRITELVDRMRHQIATP